MALTYKKKAPQCEAFQNKNHFSVAEQSQA